jgi:adenylate kinase
MNTRKIISELNNHVDTNYNQIKFNIIERKKFNTDTDEVFKLLSNSLARVITTFDRQNNKEII